MMVKLLYALLLVAMSGGVGLAIICGWLNIKLYRMDKDSRRKPLGLLLLGTALSGGVLVYAIILQGTTEASTIAVIYAMVRILTVVALSLLAGSMIKELALLEAIHNNNGPQLWLKNVEKRLLAEEARNTTIEHYAAGLADRISDEEQRGEATEGHE